MLCCGSLISDHALLYLYYLNEIQLYFDWGLKRSNFFNVSGFVFLSLCVVEDNKE